MVSTGEWMREGGILQHVFLSPLSTLVRGKTGGLPGGSRRDQYYTRVELDLKWSARLPWRRQGPTWNPLNIYFLSTELTNNWMKWEGKEQLSFLFLISVFLFFPPSPPLLFSSPLSPSLLLVFLPPPLRSSPSLPAFQLSVSVLPLKEPLEQKWNAQLADIQKKWDTRTCAGHACMCEHRTHTFLHISFNLITQSHRHWVTLQQLGGQMFVKAIKSETSAL